MPIRIVRAIGLAILFSFAAAVSFGLLIEYAIHPWAPPELFKEPRVFVWTLYIASVVSGVLGFRVGVRKRTREAQSATIKETVAAFRTESSVVRLFYFFLFVFPTALLFHRGLGGSRNDHDRIGSGVAIVVFPPMVNTLTMAISLTATPLVRRYSKG